MFDNEKYCNNPANTIEETVKLFMDTLKENEYLTIQKFNTGDQHSEEMFTARLVRSPWCYGDYEADTLYIIGNTFTSSGPVKQIVLAGGETALADFNRIEVVSRDELEIYLKKLISDWVTERVQLGDYLNEEDEIKLILHDMMFWDERNPTWTSYDSNDKVNMIWLSQYKTKEDRENLFKEVK